MPAPWHPLPLRDTEWSRIPASRVEVERLHPTAGSSTSGDTFAHVICWGGDLFVVAGQEHVERADANGERCMWARVLFVRSAVA